MGKLYVIFLIALVAVYATARDIPNENTKPSTTTDATVAPHVEKTETSVVTTADAPAANGVNDEKNFITYGGVGGWAGMGYVGGVIPVLPVLGGGVGGLGGVGGVGGLGGAGGLGGLGAAGGAAGKVIP